ncbi:MAG: tetratricopeptide repeat protein [Polyangiaceae bacterium]
MVEPTSEDFLFHLYRGSELLQDNRVHDAKEELEAALRLQPLDPKSQDLLAIVYFRLGMYPRAIEIFEQLVRAYPTEKIPRINLGLCLLKTGQPTAARQVLEETVMVHPDFTRAWGYLGLAHERLGDYVKAQKAFVKAGQEGMARRMEELLGVRRTGEIEPVEPTSIRPAAQSFVELDPMSFAAEQMARLDAPPPSLGVFRPPSLRPPPASIPPASSSMMPPSLAPGSLMMDDAPSIPSVDPGRGPASLDAFVAQRSLVFPRTTIATHPSGAARVQVEREIICRAESVRVAVASSGTFSSGSVFRIVRGKETTEPFGGPLPLVRLLGNGYLLLAPRLGRSVAALELRNQTLCVREQNVVGFEPSLRYENGRIASPDETLMVVGLAGSGIAMIEVDERVGSLDISGSAVLAPSAVLGWTGTLKAEPVESDSALSQNAGLLVFSGEGQILVNLGS